MFTIVLCVINMQLILELRNKSAIAAFLSLLSMLLYYALILLINDERTSALYQRESTGSLPEQISNIRGIAVQALVSVLVLVPALI